MSFVSSAIQEDLSKRDFGLNRILQEYDLEVQDYLEEASEYIMYNSKYDWWRRYADYQGINYTKIDSSGNDVIAFDPDKLLKKSKSLIDIHCFYTLYLIYRTISTDIEAPFKTAKDNSEMWLKEFNTYFNRLEKVDDIYDIDGDGETELSEHRRITPEDSLRYGNRWVR